jgi:hypothetical protein
MLMGLVTVFFEVAEELPQCYKKWELKIGAHG